MPMIRQSFVTERGTRRTYATTNVVRPLQRTRRASWIFCSVSVSTALVASSRRTTAGFLRIARAIATRCSSPPDSFTPRSPTTVSYPERMSVSLGSGFCMQHLTLAFVQNLFVDASRLAGLVDLLIGCITFCIPYILHDCVIKEGWTLMNNSNLLPEAITST